MNNIWNTNGPTVSFYCVPKITFCASSGHKTLCVSNIQKVILELFYFLLEVPSLKIH